MTLFEAVSNSLLAAYREDFDEAIVAWDRDVRSRVEASAIYSIGPFVCVDADPTSMTAAHELWTWDGATWRSV